MSICLYFRKFKNFKSSISLMSLFTLLQKWQNFNLSCELKQSLKNFFNVRYTYNTNTLKITILLNLEIN